MDEESKPKEALDVKPPEGDSSTPADVKPETTPSVVESEGVKKEEPKTTAEIVASIKEKYSKVESTPPVDGEEKEPKVKLDNLNKPEAKTEDKEEAPSVVVEGEKDKEEKALPETVPYARLQEVITKSKELEEPATRMRNVENYCQQRGISPEDFQTGLDLMAALKGDPKKAREILLPLVEQLGIQTGEALPKDLAQAVEDAVISPDHARELAQLRLSKQTLEQQGRQSQAQQQAEQQRAAQQYQATITTSLDDWDAAKRKNDLSFKPKSNGEPDGIYEQFQRNFLYLWNTQPVKNVQDALKLAEQAYADTQAFVKRFIPPAPAKKVLRSTGTASVASEVVDSTKPGWARQVARQVAARY